MKHVITAIAALLLWCQTTLAATEEKHTEEPVVVLKHDRTVIYPQRMKLNGNETLMDVIQMYRGMLVTGYDNILDGFQLRLDNDNLLGDVRSLLTSIRAVDVEEVQIVDNPGVQKGTTGLGGVIDMHLLKRSGAEGTIGFEASNNGPTALSGGRNASLLPSAIGRLCKPRAEMTGLLGYKYGDSDGRRNDEETLHFGMCSSLTDRDRQTIAASQQYSCEETTVETMRNRTLYVSMSNTHAFNDKGLELLTQALYLHSSSPLDTYVSRLGRNVSMNTTTNMPIALAELYVPLPVKGMDIMAGYEFDYSRTSYWVGFSDGPSHEGTAALPTEGTFSVTNHNFYAELTCSLPRWTFSIGARGILYRYGFSDHLKLDKQRTDERNTWRVSAIYRPTPASQLQLSYNRKFVNPVYAEYTVGDILGQGEYITAPEIDDEKFDETKIEQLQLVYCTKAGNVLVQTGTNYYNLQGYIRTYSVPLQWINTDTWQAQASACWHTGSFNLTAGMELTTSKYRMEDQQYKKRNTFAVFSLSPTLFLPCRWQLRAHAVCFTKYAPKRMADDNDIYASLQLNKQIGRHADLYAQWHDIFYGSHGYVSGGVRVRF